MPAVDAGFVRESTAVNTYGRRDPESLDRLRDTFAQEGIPPEFLSHYVPREPFAFLSMNDGLSDKI